MRFGIIGGTGNNDNKEQEPDVDMAQQPLQEIADLEPLGREQYHIVEEAITYKFTSLDLLELAFTHRSVQQTRSAKSDYERLEFLGDAVVDLAVAELLLNAHPEAKEGDLSKMRAALVNAASLAEVSKSIELGKYIRLSKGEQSAKGAERPSILADVFEAVIGAIYREAGFPEALRVIHHLFGDRILTVTPRDPKTELQELLHASGSEPPSYLLECVEGPEHAPTFVSIVDVDGQIVGRGRGPTKKASQQAAAAEAMYRLSSDEDHTLEEILRHDGDDSGLLDE